MTGQAPPGRPAPEPGAGIPRPEAAGPARRLWLSRRALRLHAALLVAVPGCLAAGWFELTRALAGNELSWVYVFEWPFFAAFAAVMWWRLLPGAPGTDQAAPDQAVLDRSAPDLPGGPAAAAEQDDPQLTAWQAYLARLHATSPPGGPPAAA